MKKELLNYHKTYYPMHMPGHKGGRMTLVDDLYKIDVTEVGPTDDLYEAEGIILKSLEDMESFYGSQKTMYLVNGSTVGILSSMGGLFKGGETLLVARNCHKSVFNGLRLFQLKSHYLMPSITQQGLIGGIGVGELEEALEKDPMIKGVIITSPTYDGYTSDIEALAQVCHSKGSLLIVDEAHGAHFPYHERFPKSALEQGADVVIQSPHKTLPVFTGCGLLHLSQQLSTLQVQGVMDQLRLLQTSSPSYVMMTQMSELLPQLGPKSDKWSSFWKAIDQAKKRLQGLKQIEVQIEACPEGASVLEKDPSKWLIISHCQDLNGHHIYERLCKEYGYMLESYGQQYALAILTIADTEAAIESFCDSLIDLDISLQGQPLLQMDRQVFSLESTMTERAFESYELIGKESHQIHYKASVGQVLAKDIMPYPPGIPLYMAGEVINEKMVQQLEGLLDHQLNIHGIKEEHLWILS